jgi:hypothetical protein
MPLLNKEIREEKKDTSPLLRELFKNKGVLDMVIF